MSGITPWIWDPHAVIWGPPPVDFDPHAVIYGPPPLNEDQGHPWEWGHPQWGPVRLEDPPFVLWGPPHGVPVPVHVVPPPK